LQNVIAKSLGEKNRLGNVSAKLFFDHRKNAAMQKTFCPNSCLLQLGGNTVEGDAAHPLLP
jgi:hypothetical protein